MEVISALSSYGERELQMHLAGNACSLWAKAIWEQGQQTTYLVYCHLISSFIQENMIERDQISRQLLYSLLNECKVKDQLFLACNIVKVKKISYLAWIYHTSSDSKKWLSYYLKYLNSSGGLSHQCQVTGSWGKGIRWKNPEAQDCLRGLFNPVQYM